MGPFFRPHSTCTWAPLRFTIGGSLVAGNCSGACKERSVLSASESSLDFLTLACPRNSCTLETSLPAMKWSRLLVGFFAASGAIAHPTDALYDLVKRRLPSHVDEFHFSLVPNTTAAEGYDHFKVQTTQNGTVLVQGSSISALSSGYATFPQPEGYT